MEILHVGTGNFAKAHAADYVNTLHEQGDHSWSIVASSMARSGDSNGDLCKLAQLGSQNGTYTLETVDSQGAREHRTINSIKAVVPRTHDAMHIINAGVRPQIGIVSMTIRPDGYLYNSSNKLDLEHPDVKADLQGSHKTIYGITTAILRRRQADGLAPVAMLSLDNVPKNGDHFRKALTTFVKQKGEHQLLPFLEKTGFPNTMVDRITPNPNPEQLNELAERALDFRFAEFHATGQSGPVLKDSVPITTEKNAKFVFEDNAGDFPAGRPKFENAGAVRVEDITPFLNAKTRMLNATHASVAWLGKMFGKEHIHDAMNDPDIRRAADNFVDHDVIPSLGETPVDLRRDHREIFDRFLNPHLPDENQRVGRNAYAKIPATILPTVRHRLANGGNVDASALLLAGHFGLARMEHEGRLTVASTESPAGKAALEKVFTSPEPLKAYCAQKELFNELAGHPKLVAAIEKGLTKLEKKLNEA